MTKEYRYQFKDKELIITVGKVAEQANGACLIQYGETVVLVTATASDKPREGIDFFPLSCDFQEKLYAVGKIPGGFIKREGRPTENAVLTSRLIDRPLRPLFPEGYRNDVQIIASPLSVDPNYTPDILAMIGSSVALSISDIPFQGPTAAISVGLIGNEVILYPNKEQQEQSDLDLTVAGTEDAIMMVEAGCNIVSEEIILNSILTAHEEIKKICHFIKMIQDECGKEKSEFTVPERNSDVENNVRIYAEEKLKELIRNSEKVDRREGINALEEETLLHFPEYEDYEKEILDTFADMEREEVRRLIVEEKIRPDARQLDEIRSITCERSLLPRAHGSGLFTRGQTQVLSVTTLGAPGEVQVLDGLIEEEDKHYMHQYNFPPFSVGDTRPVRGPGRREIGHGALAERALIPVLPKEADFPYTIRVVSEVLSSNGSSSQASVCGSSLSLMDAGVPISKPVAGIAMGLIKEQDEVVILSDIQGLEDHLGDMDFKVAGTDEGITALQMDIKVTGISKEILEDALTKAKEGRLHILGKMNELISEAEENLSPYAPRILTIKIDPDKVREIIGPGGKVINKIIDETGVTIDTEDDGHIVVTSADQENGEKAIKMIEDIVKEVEAGETYLAKVTRIMNFGAFAEVLPGKEGLIHISQIAHERTNKVEDVLAVGDEVMVKVTEIDRQGRINLSRKALLPKPEKNDK